MGVLPLQFPEGADRREPGLDGTETFDITGVTELNEGTHAPQTVRS
jgi:aconitate hydratase